MAGRDEFLNFPVFQVNGGDLATGIARHIRDSAIRTDQDLLRRFGNADGAAHFHGGQVHQGDVNLNTGANFSVAGNNARSQAFILGTRVQW